MKTRTRQFLVAIKLFAGIIKEKANERVGELVSE